MSLVRFLPTPSDRMGIIWSLLSVADAIVLEYGPAGTTHYSMGLYGGLGIRFQNRLFTTHMSEDDVIMGDVSRLEETIVELDKNYGPKVIFVVASSVTAVIGTDIKGVCRYMQEQVNAKLIAFEQGGFRGDYSVGCQEAYKLLVKNLPLTNVSVEPGTYNILGASMWQYRMSSNIWEINNLLGEALGMRQLACLCCNTSVDDLEQMGKASVNIVLSADGLAAAKLLEKRFGTPYVYAVPYGYTGTVSFLKLVGEAVGVAPNPMVIMRISMKNKGLSMLSMFSMMSGGKVIPKAVVKGDYDLVQGLGNFLKEAGITVTHSFVSHSLKSIGEHGCSNATCATDEAVWLPVAKTLESTLVLGDDVLLSQCGASNTKLRVSAPFLKGVLVATHLPLMGEKGADALLETINEYYQSF